MPSSVCFALASLSYGEEITLHRTRLVQSQDGFFFFKEYYDWRSAQFMMMGSLGVLKATSPPGWGGSRIIAELDPG